MTTTTPENPSCALSSSVLAPVVGTDARLEVLDALVAGLAGGWWRDHERTDQQRELIDCATDREWDSAYALEDALHTHRLQQAELGRAPTDDEFHARHRIVHW